MKCQIYCRNSSLGDKVLLRRGGRRVKEALEEEKKMHAAYSHLGYWARKMCCRFCLSSVCVLCVQALS